MTSLGNPIGKGNYDMKMSKINQLFHSYTTIPSYRGVLQITIKLGGKCTLPEPKRTIFYTCQTGGHIAHDIIGNPFDTQNTLQK